MRSRSSRLLALVAGAATALTATAVAGCSAGSAATTTTSNTSSLVLDFGDQQQYLQTLLTSSGALKGAPYQVNFEEFDSGPLVDAAFAAHRIDIGFMGDLPASLAAKAGLPVEAVAVQAPVGASMYLLAQPGIDSIAALRGKAVAYTTGTAEQAFGLRALKSAGLTQADVHQVNVSLLQLGTVLQSGSAAASVVSAEQKADFLQTHPTAKVLATTETVTPPSYDYLLATKDALASQSKQKAIGDFTKRLIQASNWMKSHQAQWVTSYYVNVEHQTPEIARVILAAGGTSTYIPITAAVQGAEQQLVNLMASSGGLPAPFSVASLYDPAETSRYNAIVKAVPQNG